jgi:hypothetical protein
MRTFLSSRSHRQSDSGGDRGFESATTARQLGDGDLPLEDPKLTMWSILDDLIHLSIFDLYKMSFMS